MFWKSCGLVGPRECYLEMGQEVRKEGCGSPKCSVTVAGRVSRGQRSLLGPLGSKDFQQDGGSDGSPSLCELQARPFPKNVWEELAGEGGGTVGADR